jgi:hypothetical protein
VLCLSWFPILDTSRVDHAQHSLPKHEKLLLPHYNLLPSLFPGDLYILLLHKHSKSCGILSANREQRLLALPRVLPVFNPTTRSLPDDAWLGPFLFLDREQKVFEL